MLEDLSPTTGPLGATAADLPVTPLSPPGYELHDEIGRGGMGVVYRAYDTALDRDVAVKLLSEGYPADSPAAQRFRSEARITGQLQHPGIPAVHQFGTLADGRPFLAMKLIRGTTLADILQHRTDPLADRGQLLAIFEAICQAVGYAHAHRVIHRDLKPSNVMVGRFGEVQVMDWGLAKVLTEDVPLATEALAAEATRAWTEVSPTPETGSHTQAGSLVGTPAFIPPEQALGEIDKVNERADVFGLGAVLAVILTGRPPYVGESFESVRVQAARGKLEDCFARLDACGAEPELIALCKQCLAFEPKERPHDAGAVAQAVAGLRAAAEERARTAERDQAAAAARSAERRKRRRLWLGAAASLALAALGGLSAVLAVQARARYDLEAKNAELSAEQAKVEARNQELADERGRVEQRFELAQRAIALFHTGVSEEALLKNAEFKDLRTKLLKEAKGFYEDLEKLLAGQTDAKSRKALAAAYFELAELTDKIGDQKQALAVQRKALALWRELAAAPGADVETRLYVGRSLWSIGWLLQRMGNYAEARVAHEEQRDLAEGWEAPAPTDAVRLMPARTFFPEAAATERIAATDAVRVMLAGAHHSIGQVFRNTARFPEALDSSRKALAIYEKLADANPSSVFFRQNLASTYNGIGVILSQTGKPADGLELLRKASDILQKLADTNPDNIHVQEDLAKAYGNTGLACWQTGKLAEALEASRKSLAVFQQLTDAKRAVTEFQFNLARAHEIIGILLSMTGKPEEAMEAHLKGLTIKQRVFDANPTVPEYQRQVANSHNNLGQLLARQKRFAEALTHLDAGLAMRQKLAQTDPKNTVNANNLGYSHAYRGWALVRSGQLSKAAADLRQAVELWAKEPVSNPQTPFERSRALALLAGLGGEANSGVTKAEAAAFADQAVAAFQDAVKAGWRDFHDLKEPDFDPLRGRDDFKKLLAELEAAARPEARPKAGSP
jgi:tetratricopeptide (TPR) repeat protein